MRRKKNWITTAAVVGAWCALSSSAWATNQVAPGTVIFDFDTHTEFCDPDYWSFFGEPTVDFGSTGVHSEDSHAVFTKGDWTACDLRLGEPSCRFLGSRYGGGRMLNQPLCGGPGGPGSGVADADLDLSLGTGVTFRVLLDLSNGQGTEGVRAQFQLIDSNGVARTTAVVPRQINARPWVNRAYPLKPGEWTTITVWFDGLDSSWDVGAVAGNPAGLDIFDIWAFRLMWRRGATSSGKNLIAFDEITPIDDPPVLWADSDGDSDVDLDDFAWFQQCFGADPTVEALCRPLDANYDLLIDYNDMANFDDCMEGPGVTGGFFPWCY